MKHSSTARFSNHAPGSGFVRAFAPVEESMRAFGSGFKRVCSSLSSVSAVPAVSAPARMLPFVPSRSKLLRGFMAFTLAFGLAGAVPATAFAGEAESAQDWAGAVAAAESPAYAPYSSATAALQTYSNSVPDASPLDSTKNIDSDFFDLREYGVVTPVKSQSPWGTCWGFSAIAAAETSILSEKKIAGQDISDGIDLSERHFAYYAYVPVPYAPFGLEPGDLGYQEGEGAYVRANVEGTSESNPNYVFNHGGLMSYATTVFSAGIGPVLESVVPYKNKEGAVDCYKAENGVPIKNDAGKYVRTIFDEATALAKEETGDWVRKRYSQSKFDENHQLVPSTWALLDEFGQPDTGLWLTGSYELEESNILPEMREFKDNVYIGPNDEATQAVKQELLEGRAVSVGFLADTSLPDQNREGKYLNENTWSHYTYENEKEDKNVPEANHAVTIVGWDDNYAVDKFNHGSVNGKNKFPPGPGAWIVKNSWGAETEDFPNTGSWGLENENGERTGYFYISYYDETLICAETFDFDLSAAATEQPEYSIDQYNYLIADKMLVNKYEGETAAPMANVFAASEGQTVRTLTCETTQSNTKVTYELYLLDGSAEDPVESPVQGEPVVTMTETYEHGGFHRKMIPEEDWVPMREGQLYSVVVTQKALDADGKTVYYQSVASHVSENATQEAGNTASMPESPSSVIEDATSDAESTTSVSENASASEDVIRVTEGASNASENASDVADTSTVADDSAVAEDVPTVEEKDPQPYPVYFKAQVNPGESWTFQPSKNQLGTGQWADWSGVLAAMTEKERANKVYDNFPIKAYADYTDYASAATLTSLSDWVAAAQAKLDGTVVSADGTDVASGTMWATEAARQRLATAIADARALLANAGNDFNKVLLTTPYEEAVTAAIATLEGEANTFTASLAAGTKATQGTGETPIKKPAKGNGAFAKTADPSVAFAGMAASAAGLAVAAAAGARIARRRNR